MSQFLENKIRLVDDLVESDIRYGIEDLGLILCTVVSACASRRWPGEGFDRKRFVELLVRDSPPEAKTSLVSVAALVNNHLVDESDTPFADGSTRIYRDDEIDLSLADAAKRYPHVEVLNLKRCSYAFLIYKWLRCGYAHNYLPGEHVTQFEASRHEARLSYIGQGRGAGLHRMTSFHFDYLRSLALHHAANDPEKPSPQPQPAKWWIEIETL